MLFCFLVGIAVGSAIGKRFCERHDDLLRTSAHRAGRWPPVVDLSLLFLVPALLHVRGGCWACCSWSSLTAALKSIMFPIAHHLGSQQSGARIGRSVSKVYFGNIVGSTLGPIVTGYVLLDRLSLDNCLLLVGLLTGLLSLLCAGAGPHARRRAGVAAVIAPVAALAWPGAVDASVQSIAMATDRVARARHHASRTSSRTATASSTRSASPNGEPETILGGNVYDGRINVDMESQSQPARPRRWCCWRCIPNPERVLVVGLSTGAWAQAAERLAAHQGDDGGRDQSRATWN